MAFPVIDEILLQRGNVVPCEATEFAFCIPLCEGRYWGLPIKLDVEIIIGIDATSHYFISHVYFTIKPLAEAFSESLRVYSKVFYTQECSKYFTTSLKRMFLRDSMQTDKMMSPRFAVRVIKS